MKHFEMYTAKGDAACAKAVERLIKVINKDKFLTEKEVDQLVEKEMGKIDVKHPEVHDTEPRYHMRVAINKALKARGYNYTIDL